MGEDKLVFETKILSGKHIETNAQVTTHKMNTYKNEEMSYPLELVLVQG